VGVLS